MNDSWEVVDIEKSLCGFCVHTNVCFRLDWLKDLWKPLAKFQVVVTECSDYKGGISKEVWANIAGDIQEREEAVKDAR